MKAERLKEKLRDGLWSVVDRHGSVLSATLTGSFADSPTLEGISDIDFVLVLDEINAPRYEGLLADFGDELRPALAEAGYRLRINPTLGPLKFNEPDLAVLHLMLYSHAGHVDHVIQSPFTCLDWQKSGHVRKRSLAEVYPVFGLQPRHFLGAPSLSDYLRDFRANTVSYRELVCDEVGYVERKQGKPMTVRDRHEFAYHVIRFLMRNLLKLVGRTHDAPSGDAMLDAFFAVFPARAAEIRAFFLKVAAMKRAVDFSRPLPDLDAELEAFLATFERQFRRAFFDEATRHVVFRHAETAANRGASGEVVFLGRTDAPVAPGSAFDAAPAESVASMKPAAVYSSPMLRCRQTLAKVGLWPDRIDDRLSEIDYGRAEGLTVAAARAEFPELFAAWSRGEDAPFPGGECTASVLARVRSFAADCWPASGGDTVTCTHNVVLRCLVGDALGVPVREWHRLRVPHLAPVAFVETKQFGRFVDLGEPVEREVFRNFASLAG